MNKNKAGINFLKNNVLILILLAMVIFVGIVKDNFISVDNLISVATNTSVRFIIALGVSGCLITRGTDLSAGRIVGLGACVAATLLQQQGISNKFYPNMGEVPLFAALLASILVCACFGLLNGFVISVLRLPPFIATLGMQLIVYGVCLVYTGAKPLGNFTESFLNVARGSLLGVKVLPYLFIFALVLGLIMFVLYNKMKYGKFMYAIGGNEIAAEVSGVNVTKMKITIYTLAAALYGIAGFLLASKAGGATVGTGEGYELEAIAACTIGGVSTNGGVGRVSGVLIGVLIFELLKSSLQFMGVNTSYQYIVQGLVIIIAVAFDLRKYLQKK